MTFKEHLQFLAMMIPTFLLLCAVMISLAFPAPLPAPVEMLAAPLGEVVAEADAAQ